VSDLKVFLYAPLALMGAAIIDYSELEGVGE
jgi:hypothetical protein